VSATYSSSLLIVVCMTILCGLAGGRAGWLVGRWTNDE
jgi:hypothetical protein